MRANAVAKVVSGIFHPLFMPLYTLALLFNIHPGVFFNIPAKGRPMIYLMVFTYTVFLPLLTVLILKRARVIQTMEMHTRAERKWAYLVAATCYFFCYYLLIKFPGLALLSFMLLGATVGLLLLIAANFFVKVSAHALGVGGVCGIICVLIFLLGVDYSYLLMLLFLLSGWIAWARLQQEAHSEWELYAGFLLGFFSEFGLFAFFL
jgi:hypothetical protein